MQNENETIVEIGRRYEIDETNLMCNVSSVSYN